MSRRRGSIAAHLLIWVAAVTGATAAVALQVPSGGGSVESWIVPGLVVTLLLLLLGKMSASERTLGKLEGAWAENSKRDDAQEQTIRELWHEARGVEGRLKEVRQEAIDQCTDQVDRVGAELDDLQDRVRELERGGTRQAAPRTS